MINLGGSGKVLDPLKSHQRKRRGVRLQTAETLTLKKNKKMNRSICQHFKTLQVIT